MVDMSGKSFWNMYFNAYKDEPEVFITDSMNHFERKYELKPSVIQVSQEIADYLGKLKKPLKWDPIIVVSNNVSKEYVYINDEISETT